MSTYNRKILFATGAVGVATILARLVSAAKDLVTAAILGTSDAADAFLIAMVIPAFIVTVVAASFANGIVPEYLKSKRNNENANKLLCECLSLLTCALAILGISIYCYSDVLANIIGSGFSVDKVALVSSVLSVLAIFPFFGGLAQALTSILHADEKFGFATFLSATPALAMITFLLLCDPNFASFSLAWGAVIGSAIQCFVLYLLLKKHGVDLSLKFWRPNPTNLSILQSASALMMGAAIMATTDIVDQTMAGALEPGSVASLNYGTKVVALVLGIVSSSLSAGAYPYFARMAADNDLNAIWQTYKYWALRALVIGGCLAFLIAAASHPIAKILFERGSFLASDTARVADIQLYASLQIPFYAVTILAVRPLMSLNLNRYLLYTSTASTLLNIIFNIWFVRYFEVAGIALSTSCVYILAALFLTSVLWIEIGKKLKHSK